MIGLEIINAASRWRRCVRPASSGSGNVVVFEALISYQLIGSRNRAAWRDLFAGEPLVRSRKVLRISLAAPYTVTR